MLQSFQITHIRYEIGAEPPRSLALGETCTKAGESHLQCDCEEFNSPSLHHVSLCLCSSVTERSPCKRGVASLILRQRLHGAIFYELGKPVFTRLKRVRISLALPSYGATTENKLVSHFRQLDISPNQIGRPCRQVLKPKVVSM